MSGSSEEKDLPATDKKLADAREKGQVPKSPELVTAAVTMAASGYVMTQLPGTTVRFTQLITASADAINQPFWQAIPPFVEHIMVVLAIAIAPLMLVVLSSTVLANLFAMGGPLISFTPLIPDLNRINPAQGFKNLFRLNTIVDLLKNLVKLVVVVSVSVGLIKSAFQPLVEQPRCGLACSATILAATVRPLLIMAAVFFVFLGFFDVALQRWLFARTMKMSKTELKQETKNSEGDPVIKGAQKRLRNEAAQTRSGLRQATFLIAGPKAVAAMRFSTKDTRVPTMMVKGADDRASDVLAEAKSMQIPVYFDPDLAHRILENVKLGHPIGKELFQPVIAAMNKLGLLTQ